MRDWALQFIDFFLAAQLMIVIRGKEDNTLSEKNFALYNYLKRLFLLMSWVCDFFFHFERHLCFLGPILPSLCYRQSSVSHSFLRCTYPPTPCQEGNWSVPTGQFGCSWCFFCENNEGRYSFRSEAGRNTTKVARDAFHYPLEEWRLSTLEATKCYWGFQLSTCSSPLIQF